MPVKHPCWGLALLPLLCSSARTLPLGTNQTAPAPGTRPLVAILSVPGGPAAPNSSYIAASYVKFVESGGARAVPLPFDLPAPQLRGILGKVNAVLVPGGGAKLSPHHGFYDAVALILREVLAANDAGTHFPLHGTCLGFEALALVVSGNASLLTTFDAEDYASDLNFTAQAGGSRFFGAFPPQVVRDLGAQPLAMQNHKFGVATADFAADPRLRDFFEVLTVSQDRQGAEYISTVESRRYPITATQWHPEKNSFEWTRGLAIPHSAAAVEVTHAVATFLVGEARRNSRAPANASEEDALLIYNYRSVYTGRTKGSGGVESDFDEAYLFGPSVGGRPRQPVQ